MELSPEERQKIYQEEKARIEAQRQIRAELQDKRSKTSGKFYLGCLAGVVLFLFVIGFMMSAQKGNIRPVEDKGDDKQREAFHICRQFVQKSLKAPSTSDFASYYDDSTRVTNYASETYDVSSYFDAENSFGAKIRNHFTCTVKDVGNDQWSLQELEIK